MLIVVVGIIFLENKTDVGLWEKKRTIIFLENKTKNNVKWTVIIGKYVVDAVTNGKCVMDIVMNGKCIVDIVMYGKCVMDIVMNGKYVMGIGINRQQAIDIVMNQKCIVDILTSRQSNEWKMCSGLQNKIKIHSVHSDERKIWSDIVMIGKAFNGFLFLLLYLWFFLSC